MKLARPLRADWIATIAIVLVGIIETSTSSKLEATPLYYLAALCTTIPLAWRRSALDVRDRVQAVVYAYESGVVVPGATG